MTKLLPVFVLTAAASLLAIDVRAQQPAAIRSVDVTFPDAAYAFPPGEGVDLVTSNCTACHSPGMILTQPKLSPAAWTGEVQKMQRTYMAPVAEADVPAIVAYLSTLPQPGHEK